jgi:hypothetical protein
MECPPLSRRSRAAAKAGRRTGGSDRELIERCEAAFDPPLPPPMYWAPRGCGKALVVPHNRFHD